MEKIISIDGKQIGFKATASTIKRYRQKYNRDFLKDIKPLMAKVEQAKQGDVELSADDLEVFERIAYIMAWQYDNTVPQNEDDWLDQFSMFGIWEVLPQIAELWTSSQVQLEKPKKKVEEQSEN